MKIRSKKFHLEIFFCVLLFVIWIVEDTVKRVGVRILRDLQWYMTQIFIC